MEAFGHGLNPGGVAQRAATLDALAQLGQRVVRNLRLIRRNHSAGRLVEQPHPPLAPMWRDGATHTWAHRWGAVWSILGWRGGEVLCGAI